MSDAATANTTYHNGSLWFDGLDHPPASELQPLPGKVDVAIVGGGYTGLWTAYYLKRAEPALNVAVLEAEVAGFGASGRNGGWCIGAAWGLERLLENPQTRSRGLALQRALFDTVAEVGRVCQAEDIDCHYARGGSLRVASTGFHAGRQRRDVERLHGLGFTEQDYRWLEADAARSRINLATIHGAVHFSHCAAIQPARLVRGLAATVRSQGTLLLEQTPVTAIEAGRVTTHRGTLRARHVLRATEAYTASLRGQRRAMLPIYSMMVATEPLPAAVWNEIGLHHRETFGDDRRVVMYGQRTLDDRLAFGGRAGYAFASRRRRTVPADDGKVRRVGALLYQLFPQIAGYRLTHGWGGVLGVPRHWRPCVSYDRSSGLGWAGGYVGEGVAASNLAARTLSDLVLGHDSALTELPWVEDVPRNWEPEPIRWCGAKAIEFLGDRADQAELRHNRPSRFWGGLFNTLVG